MSRDTMRIFKHSNNSGSAVRRTRQFLSAVLLLASVVGTSHAGAVQARGRSAHTVQEWKPPAPTGTGTGAGDGDQWNHLRQSHRPTDAPRLRGYNGLGDDVDLRKRELSIVSYDTAPVGSNTCGFFTDDGFPMWCNAGYSCTNIGSIRDCCAGNDCKTSSFSSVCLDYTDPACSSYTPGTKCCGGPGDPQAAYCATYLWATSENPREIFTLFECDEKQYVGNYFLWAEKPIFVSDYVPASTTSRPPLPNPPGSSGSTGINSASSDGDSSGSSANSGPNVGAIVGGVIGGVALVGVFLLIFYYMRIRGKKAVAAAAAAAAEKAHHAAAAAAASSGHGSEGGGPGGGTGMIMHSPPPPSESFWGGTSTGSGSGGPDPAVGSTSPATVANSTSAILTPEQQPLVQHHQYTPQQIQQMQEWQTFQLQQQYNMFQQQQGLGGGGGGGQWIVPQDPRIDVQQIQAMQQQEETDRGMAMGMAMGMNIMMGQGRSQGRDAAKEKSPIEMSNSPTSYEVSTASLYQELEVGSQDSPAGRRELPG